MWQVAERIGGNDAEWRTVCTPFDSKDLAEDLFIGLVQAASENGNYPYIVCEDNVYRFRHSETCVDYDVTYFRM